MGPSTGRACHGSPPSVHRKWAPFGSHNYAQNPVGAGGWGCPDGCGPSAAARDVSPPRSADGGFANVVRRRGPLHYSLFKVLILHICQPPSSYRVRRILCGFLPPSGTYSVCCFVVGRSLFLNMEISREGSCEFSVIDCHRSWAFCWNF